MARGLKRAGTLRDDRLLGRRFDDTLLGDRGDDTLVGRAGADRLVGAAGRDVLKGAGGDDRLFGGGANDRLIGGGGADLLVGGGGNDRLFGGAAQDTLKGGGGRDSLFGGGGDDRLFGGAAQDMLKGAGGDDRLVGGGGNDRLFGGAGRDSLFGGGGNDRLFGGGGNDRLIGGGGADRLVGGGGRDNLKGGGGDDRLFGGGGNDRLFGGKGGDTIVGGPGNDTMAGGAGADVFVFKSSEKGPSTDTILDFARGVDEISLVGFSGVSDFGDLTISNSADGAVVALGGGKTIVLKGVTKAQLSAADFGLAPAAASGPPIKDGTAGPDTLAGGAASELVRGFGGDDVIGTSGGVDTLVGGAGADKFVIRLENGQIGAQVDIVEDFQYALGDVIGLTEALSGVPYTTIDEVVRATPQAGGTMIAVNRGGGFQDALFLKGVSFTTEQLQNYGFSAPALGSAAFVENPYGFTNTSNTTADPVATRDGVYVAWVDKQNIDNAPNDVTPFKDNDTFDTNEDSASRDIFIRNLATGSVERVSVDENGDALTTDGLALNTTNFQNAAESISPAMSGNGRYVVFATDGKAISSDTNGSGDVYLRDMLTGDGPVLISTLGGAAGAPMGDVPIGSGFGTDSASVVDISDNGRLIAFVSGDNVYLRDRIANTTELVSAFVNSDGTSSFAAGGVPNAFDFSTDYEGDMVHISGDGRYVFYVASNSQVFAAPGSENFDNDGDVDLYVRDTLLDRTLLVTGNGVFGKSFDIQSFDVSFNGRRVAFATREAIDDDDTNDTTDVYLAEIDLAAWAASASAVNPPANLIDIRRVSEATGGFEAIGADDTFGGAGYSPVISPDGTRVAFISDATDIAPVNPNSFFGGTVGLYEVDLATGVLSKAPGNFSFDSSGNTILTRAAYDLTDEGIVYRTNITGGDTIATGTSVPPPNIDVPADGSGSARLEVVSGTVLRSSLEPVKFLNGSFVFDTDTYQVFGGGSGFTVSVEAEGRGVGTHPDIGVRIRQDDPTTGTIVASDLDSGFGNDAYINFAGAPASAYFVQVFGEGFSGGSYRVRIDYDFPSNGVDTPVQLPYGQSVTDSLFSTSGSDWFQYEAQAGMRYTVTLNGTGGNPLTTGIVRVRDGQGDLQQQSSAGADSFTFVAQNDGLGFIEIATSGDTGGYTVSIDEDPLIIVFPPIIRDPIFVLGAEEEPLQTDPYYDSAAWLL